MDEVLHNSVHTARSRSLVVYKGLNDLGIVSNVSMSPV